MKMMLLGMFLVVSGLLVAAPLRDGRYSEGYPGDYRGKRKVIGDGRYSEGYTGDYSRGRYRAVEDGRYAEGYPGRYRDEGRYDDR